MVKIDNTFIDKNAYEFLGETLNRALLWGRPLNYIESEDNNIKYAWVLIDGEKRMIGVNNKTMDGYAMKQDTPEWKLPLEKIKYSQFLRWCTSFDL